MDIIMETLPLNLESKNEIITYRDENNLVKYEYGILDEIITAIDKADLDTLSWFSQFGDRVRCITMNVHAYRKGLEFGFTTISFDKYGWFTRPEFLDKEELTFGDTSRYGNHSLIYLGRGENNTWTYGKNYSFGVAGGCYGLSVYGKQFNSRQDALNFALNELKIMMTKKIGSTDTTNDKQPVVLATLRDIAKAEISMVQLTLF
ncbi:MAG: hypothetical protein NVSMB24_38660 [Mucilaginibacter sp.]